MEGAARGAMLTLFLLLPVVFGANPYWKFHKDAPGNIICPDGGECPDGDTCCPTATGTYGCCPDPNAVCCSDGKHCCPEGYQCDVSAGTCTKADIKVSLQELVKAPENVVCPDGGECPDGDTCCPTATGTYGCCPDPNAVCCSDGKHCCPEGYQCDVSAGTCTKADIKVSLQELVKAPEDVVCSDGSTCPDGDTCCEQSGGGYACCPLPSAVCCSDGVHCCPAGYTCDVSAGTCLKSSLNGLEDKIPFLKYPASRRL